MPTLALKFNVPKIRGLSWKNCQTMAAASVARASWERLIRELRRGTKVRDHKFPKEEAVYKLLYLESERQEGRWTERKLKGFSEVKEVLEKMLQERYAPRTQTLTHNS